MVRARQQIADPIIWANIQFLNAQHLDDLKGFIAGRGYFPRPLEKRVLKYAN